MGAWSAVGLVLGLVMFLVSFAPSLLPRRWLLQGLVGGFSAATGYLVGFLLEMTVDAVMRLVDLDVQVSWHLPGGIWILAMLGVVVVIVGWWWSVREHRETARLVGMTEQPPWRDIAATAVALATMVLLMVLIRSVVLFTAWVSQGLDLFLPSVLSVVVALIIALAVVRMVNRMVFQQALERISRQADKLDRRRPRNLQPPQLPTRSGSAGSGQPWAELGRRGQIFTSCGPSAADIAAVLGGPSAEPIRVYASLGDGAIEAAVEMAMAEVRRTGALDRGTLVIDTPAGRGWVDEFSVQAVEYLTGGDCATVSVQYSKLASAFVFLADPETPRACARALFAALEEAIHDLPAGRRPKIYASGESLGAYGGHGAFADADDMLAKVDGALWIGTPGITELARTIARSRMRGSPEITPVIDNGRHIRFATKPPELVADAYGRPLGEWDVPRVVYLQHASDPMCRFNAELAWREPDWMRERAGSDVNTSLRWWPLVTWFQITTDMLTSLDTPAGHGHIYEDELVPAWAAVLGRADAPITTITAAIRASVEGLKASNSLTGSGNSAS
ncbi:MAG: alpha/beta-hydrolase family protein [Micropruina sp.]|uniref:alpha/beta hydrolase n=1 Tax=Micropruina sp. TaxID=2737536 RepID=UPI0039E572DD